MQQGKSVPEIAAERKLQPSTIYGHITKMCDINDPWVLGRLVPEDMQKAMNDYFDSHEELPSMASLIQEELKSAYGVEADNGQIRIMMTLLDRRSGKSSVSSENSPSSESSENSENQSLLRRSSSVAGRSTSSPEASYRNTAGSEPTL